MRSGLSREVVIKKLKELLATLFSNIPSGVGSHRKDLKLTEAELGQVLTQGVRWAVRRGFGSEEDLAHIEAQGCIPGADPDRVSSRAMERGRAQLGTVGSGNHFVEVGYVEEIYDEVAAAAYGLEKDLITVLIHTGSRGLGHQICDDYIRVMQEASRTYGIELPDPQLCCAPIDSPQGQDYLAAMAAAANFAFVNRQIIDHWTRESFELTLQMGPKDLGLQLVYDVCHNIAKIESHKRNGSTRQVCVHRKGATRAFPPGHPDVPADYRSVGQPVLIPGDMGRYSYVLAGTVQAYEETFGSTCHGAGRLMSRHQAKKAAKGRSIERELEARGILIRGASRGTIVEELPDAYKDVADVVRVVQGAGISKKVARLRPLAVVKG